MPKISTEIRALSLLRPYSTLLAEGLKTIEIRTWRTNYRGWVLLHTSGSTAEDYELETWGLLPEECPRSAIVGAARLTHCVEYSSARMWQRDEENHCCFGVDYSSWLRAGKAPIGHVMVDPIAFDEPILDVGGALNYWQPRTEKQQRGFKQAIALLNEMTK